MVMTDIVIPMKNLADAKLRLSSALNQSQRESLTIAMLEDILGRVKELDHGRVWVVSSDEYVLDLANKLGAIPLQEASSIGYNEAIITWMRTQRVEGNIAIIPGDVPLASQSELWQFVAPHTDATPCVRIAPDLNHEGTNGLFLSSTKLICPAFGPGSFARHVKLAESVDLDPIVVNVPNLALDIDTPDDLLLLAKQNPKGATGKFLHNNRLSIDQLTNEHVA